MWKDWYVLPFPSPLPQLPERYIPQPFIEDPRSMRGSMPAHGRSGKLQGIRDARRSQGHGRSFQVAAAGDGKFASCYTRHM